MKLRIIQLEDSVMKHSAISRVIKNVTEVLTTIEESDIPAIPLETKRQIKKIGFAC